MKNRMPSFYVGSAIFLVLFSFSPGWILSHDASARLVVARQLWQQATPFFSDTSRSERFLSTPHGLTTYFGIGQSLLFIPFDMIGTVLSQLFSVSADLKGHLQTLPLTLLYLPLCGWFWWYSMLLWLRENGITERRSLVVSTLVSLTTLALPYAAQSLQEEAIVGALLLWFLIYFSKALKTNDHRMWKRCGLFASLILLFRVNAIFGLAGSLSVWLDSKNKKISAKHFLIGSTPGVLLLLYFNAVRFGNPFLFGHTLHHRDLFQKGIETWRSPNFLIGFSLLFGIGKGFFTLSPLLWIGFINLRRIVIPLVILLSSALFHSQLKGFACGGMAWGPRFQVHLIGLFLLPVALAFSQVSRHLLIALCFSGMVFQSAAILAPDSLEYLQEMALQGAYKEELITSAKQGQLPKRIRNIIQWITHKPLEAEGLAPILTDYRKYYFPSFWPAQLSRLAPKSYRSLFWGLWVVAVGIAVGLFAWVVSPLFQSPQLFKRRLLDT